MPVGEVIAIASLALALITSVTAGLVYAYKIGGLFTMLTSAIADLNKLRASVERIPLLEQKTGQLEEVVESQERKLSDFPRMRERLDSVTDEVGDMRKRDIPERLAVLERRESFRGMPATRLSQGRDPRKEGGD